MQSITIGPEFFAKARNDYADWRFAVIREFAQNGVDAGSSEIQWTCHEEGGKTHLTVRNDGEPMGREILFSKLLSLGSSGKDFAGESTGGFGKAKEILYFCWDSYRIHSGDLIVSGTGGSYEESSNGYFAGTESSIVIDGCYAEELCRAFRTWCFYAQVKCRMTWNGEEFSCDMRKGSVRRDMGFAKVYTNRSCERRMVVRINGMPMFVQSISLDRCVVVELSGKSDEVMTSNRDALNDYHRWELSDFVTELAVDKKSALKPRQPKYRHYDGSRLCHRKVQGMQVSDILQITESVENQADQDGIEFDLVHDQEPQGIGSGGEFPMCSGDSGRAAAFGLPAPVQQVQVAIGEEFVIKNETDLVIPTYYRPDEPDWSAYSRKLARIWGRLMLQLHRTFDAEATFAIGFLFADDEQLAEWENGQFGTVYYICPARLVEQSGSRSKSWKRLWKLTDRNQILMAAVHEFVHGRGHSQHDEEYAAKLTHAAAKVMDRRKDFNWCFG